MDDWLLRVRRKFLVRSPLVDTFTNVADLEQDDFLDALSSVVHAARAAPPRGAAGRGRGAVAGHLPRTRGRAHAPRQGLAARLHAARNHPVTGKGATS